jgi:cytochrome b561
VAAWIGLVGILALMQDSWPIALLHRDVLHVLFGVLLWIWVVARFYAYQFRSARLPTDLRALARNLSRRVFLLLYAMMFLRLIIEICRDASRPMSLALADFQVYLAAGCIALVTIHLLAALCRYAAAHQTPVSMVLSQRNGRLT